MRKRVRILCGQEEGLPGGSDGLKTTTINNAFRCRRSGFNLCVKKIPWRRKWQPTPGFLPGESPWKEEPGELESMESQRVRHDCNNNN